MKTLNIDSKSSPTADSLFQMFQTSNFNKQLTVYAEVSDTSPYYPETDLVTEDEEGFCLDGIIFTDKTVIFMVQDEEHDEKDVWYKMHIYGNVFKIIKKQYPTQFSSSSELYQCFEEYFSWLESRKIDRNSVMIDVQLIQPPEAFDAPVLDLEVENWTIELAFKNTICIEVSIANNRDEIYECKANKSKKVNMSEKVSAKDNSKKVNMSEKVSAKDNKDTKKNTMKKTYTKKQITEAIAYWKIVLEGLDENDKSNDITVSEMAKKLISMHEKDNRVGDMKLVVRINYRAMGKAFEKLDDKDFYPIADKSTHTLKSGRLGISYIDTFGPEKDALTLNTVTFDGSMKDNTGVHHVTSTFLDDLKRLVLNNSDHLVRFDISVGHHYGDDHSYHSDKTHGILNGIEIEGNKIILKARYIY